MGLSSFVHVWIDFAVVSGIGLLAEEFLRFCEGWCMPKLWRGHVTLGVHYTKYSPQTGDCYHILPQASWCKGMINYNHVWASTCGNTFYRLNALAVLSCGVLLGRRDSTLSSQDTSRKPHINPRKLNSPSIFIQTLHANTWCHIYIKYQPQSPSAPL